MTTMAHDELAKLPVSDPSTTHWRPLFWLTRLLAGFSSE